MGFRRSKPVEESKVEIKEVEVKAKTKPLTYGGGAKVYHNNALTILRGQDNSIYLQFNTKSDIELFTKDGKKVTKLFSKDPFVELEESVASGRITEERAEEIAGKIPDFILANVTVVTE